MAKLQDQELQSPPTLMPCQDIGKTAHKNSHSKAQGTHLQPEIQKTIDETVWACVLSFEMGVRAKLGTL